MADARYVIDLILKARDDTSEAFASVAKNLGVAEAMQQRAKRQNDEFAESWERTNDKIITSEAKLKESRRSLGATNDKTLEKQLALERASRDYVTTLGKVNSTERERAVALSRVVEAQKSVVNSINKANESLRENQRINARATAERIKNTAIELETAEQQARKIKELAAVEEQSARRRAAANKELQRILAEADKDHERRIQLGTREADEFLRNERRKVEGAQRAAREREQILQREIASGKAARAQERRDLDDVSRARLSSIERMQAASRQLARTDLDDAKIKEFRRELIGAQRDLERTGIDANSAMRSTQRSLEEARREAGFFSRDQHEAAQAVQRTTLATREYENSLRRVAALRGERAAAAGVVRQRLELETAGAERQAAEAAATLKTLLGHIEANVDLDAGAFLAEAAEIEVVKALLGKDIDVEIDLKAGRFLEKSREVEEETDRVKGGFGGLGAVLGALSGGFDGSSNRIAAFDNLIRGAFTFLVAGFLQPLIVLAGAAAGALAALASSAIYAGGALAGAFTAGIAQALPALGVLGAFVYRLKAVFDAASQAQLLQQQRSYQGEKQAKKLADTTDAVANAQDGLRNALESVTQAQERLTTARRDAARQLQDLILQERSAQLAAEGAALSQEDAQKALAQAVATGGDVARAQLDVAQASLGVDQTRVQAGRATVDARRGRAQGVEGSDQVVQAKRQLEDAERSVEKAQRGLDKASRGADIASANITAAAGKLNFLLSRMSPAERKLFETVTKLQDAFRLAAEKITEPLISATNRVLTRVTAMLGDPRILGAFRGLAGEMAKQGEALFAHFTDKRHINTFLGFLREAQSNLRPLRIIIQNLGDVFMNIATAAAPAFRTLLDYIRKVTGDWRQFTSSREGRNKIAEFFKEGMQQAIAWMRLAGAVIRLFLAIAGAGGGAKAGGDMLKSTTDGINKLTDAINTKGSKAQRFLHSFFDTTKKVIGELGPIFTSIGHQFALTFNEQGVKSVKGFVTFLADVLIPALGKFVRNIGHATAAMGNFLKEHPGLAKMAAGALAFGLSLGFIAKASVFFHPFLNVLKLVGPSMEATTKTAGKLEKGIFSLAGRFGFMAGEASTVGEALAAIGAGVVWPLVIAAGIAFLLAKLGLLDDLGRAIGGFFTSFFNKLKPHLAGLKAAWDDLMKSLGGSGAVIGVIRGILKVVIDVGGWFLKIFGGVLGTVIGHAIDFLTGFLTFLSGVFSGDWGKMWDGIKRMFVAAIKVIADMFGFTFWLTLGKNVVKGIWNGLKGLGKIFLDLFLDAVNAVLNFLGIGSPSKKFLEIGKDILKGILNGLVGFGGFILHAFTRGFNVVFDFLKGLPGKFANLAKSAASAIVGAFKDVGSGILHAITNAPGVVGDLAKGFVNGVIGLINHALKFIHDKVRIHKFGINIGFPLIQIPKLAKGGPIPGYGGGDKVAALLEPGEHVFTKEEVRAAGGHGVIYALRRLLGGGTRGGPQGFQAGGEIPHGYSTTQTSRTQTASVNIDADTEGQAHRWRLMWDEITASTRRNAQIVETRMRIMRVNITNTIDRLYDDFSHRWQDIEDSAKRHATDLYRGVGTSFDRLQDVVYQALSYVGGATNSALRGLGSDTVKLSIRQPGGLKAATGYVGQPGERGQDAIWALVGRGEAVLNHWQQKALNAFLPAGISVQEIIRRTRGYHAGGPAQPGFAGGYAGHIPDDGQSVPIPGQPGEFIARRIVKQVVGMMQRYHMAVTDGFALSGHTAGSDHYRGLAADFVPGTGGNWDMVDRAAAYAKSKLGSVFRWIGYDGVPGHGRGNHLHLSWLADPGKLGVAAIAHLRRLIVRGRGALRDLAQQAVDRVRRAANKNIDAASDSGFADAHPVVEGGLSTAQVARVINQAMGILDVPNSLRSQWRAMALRRAWQESSFNPNIVNRWDSNAQRGTPSEGLFQTIGPTFAAYSLLGHQNILNPLDNTLAAFRYMLSRYGEGNWHVALQRMLGQAGQGYATGGIIPGDFEGAPQPVLAHAGEWILNRRQQSKIADMIGTSISKVRAALGFSGGPGSFQGGGEVIPTDTQRQALVRRGTYRIDTSPGISVDYYAREIGMAFAALRVLKREVTGRNGVKRFIGNMGKLIGDGGLISQMDDAIDRHAQQMATAISLAANGIRRIGRRLVSIRPLTAVQQASAELAASQTTGGELAANRARTTAGLGDVEAQIRRLGRITPKNRAVYEKLVGERNAFLKELDKQDGLIAQNLADQFQRATDLFQAQTDAALRHSKLVTTWGNFLGRVGQTLGNTDLIAQGGQALLDSLKEQQRVIGQQLQEAQAKAKSDPRWQAIADQLGEQFLDVSASIIDQQHKALSDAVDAMEKRYSTYFTNLDLQGRGVDLAERAGDRRGAAQARVGLQRQRTLALGVQQMEYERLRTQAAAQGDEGLVKDLTAKIRELTAQIAESVAATRDLIIANQQLAIDIINGTTQATTGFIGGAISIVEKLGEISDGPDTQALLSYYNRIGDTLVDAGTQIASKIRDALNDPDFTTMFGEQSPLVRGILDAGREAFQQGPQAFAEWLARNAPQISQIIQALGPDTPAGKYLSGLIDSMTDNTTAILDNTISIKDLTDKDTELQGFSTTAWQQFRTAIFDGLGGLLPQYNIPQAQTGGMVTKAGIFELHEGELVIQPGIAEALMNFLQGGQDSALGAGSLPRVNAPGVASMIRNIQGRTDNSRSTENKINVYVTEPTEVLDPNYVASRIGWELRTRGR